MKLNFLYFFLYLIVSLFFVSCANESFQKMGLIKKKPNQFAVSRKAPLEMPPDMLLMPPKPSKERKNKSLSIDDDDQFSLNDILNNKQNNKVKATKSKLKKPSKENRILKKILNTKATVLK